jgi:hypothetical protein
MSLEDFRRQFEYLIEYEPPSVPFDIEGERDQQTNNVA